MKDRIKACNWFQVLFFMLGILYLFILPPFTAPDEAGHFATAYHYANILCGVTDPVLESTAGNIYREIAMREQDAVLYERLAAEGGYSVLRAFITEMPLWSIENVAGTQCLCRTMPYIFPLYLPAMAAILICRFVGFGSVIMVYLARFLTFLAAWYIVCRAIERIPAGKKIFQVIALFPMALHLFSSCSADAAVNAAAAYGSAIILCYQQAPMKLRRTDGAALVVSLTIVTLAKPFYILFFAMGLLMPQEAFGRKRYFYMFCLIPLSFWLWKYLPLVFSCFSKGDVSVYADLSQGYSAGYILSHPIGTALLFVRSIWKQLPYIGAGSIGLYLGPLAYRIPSTAVVVFLVLLLGTIFGGEDGQQILDGRERIGAVLLFIFTYICCYGVMLLWWTPFGADEIEGMQGRNMLPLLGMLCIALEPAKKVKWKCPCSKNQVIFMVFMAEAVTHIHVLISVYRQLAAGI